MASATAGQRLKKLLLFDFAKRLKRDICFRCGQRIETLREFSIDHKSPWLGQGSELFWDVENIAFSHWGCNASASRNRDRKGRKPV